MDTMVLLVGDSRRDENDDRVRSHILVGVPKQIHWRAMLAYGGDAVIAVPVNSQVKTISCLDDNLMGGNII